MPLSGSGWFFWVGIIVIPKLFFCSFATECSPSHKVGLLGIYLRVSVKRKNNFCVRRRRTCGSRAVFTEITLKGIDRDAMRYQALGAILACLTSYVAQIASISCANVFLAALSWRYRFFCAISTIQKTFCRDRTHFSNLWLLLVIVINQEMFWNFSHVTFCFSTNSRNKKEINSRHILLLD